MAGPGRARRGLDGLTPKRRKFVEEYLRCAFNGVEAARGRAGGRASSFLSNGQNRSGLQVQPLILGVLWRPGAFCPWRGATEKQNPDREGSGSVRPGGLLDGVLDASLPQIV